MRNKISYLEKFRCFSCNLEEFEPEGALWSLFWKIKDDDELLIIFQRIVSFVYGAGYQQGLLKRRGGEDETKN